MTTASPPRTAVPAPPVAPAARLHEVRVRISTASTAQVSSLAGSAAGAIALVWLVFDRLAPLSGALGFWVCCYLVFLLLYTLIAMVQFGSLVVRDQFAMVAAGSAGVFSVAVIIDQVGYVIVRGWPALSHGNFWTQTMQFAGPLQPLTDGGVLQGLVGSLEQLGIATLFSVPLGVLAALFLAEIGGPLAQPVRIIVTAMTGLPEIVAGLFIYATVLLALGTRGDGFSASLALTVMMLPIVTRGSEVMLRLVPGSLREASYALGGSQWRTVWNVVLPTARSGLTTVSVLGMARAVGETAPLLFTSGFTNILNANPFSGPQAALPIIIWNDITRNTRGTMVDRGFGAGLALMLMVLVLFAAARILGGGAPGELSRRQRRRVARDARHAAGR